MASNVDSLSWKVPRCLVENVKGDGDDAMHVNKDTVAALYRIDVPLVVVSIVGLYRTGKSYLMNRLAGSKSGFDLGNTVEAKTKGIWVWCVPHPLASDRKLLLMDTEGLGDPEKGSTRHDTMLFTLAALLSSTLVYNSRGTIDQTAIDSMHFITRIAENFTITDKKETAEEDDALLGQYFPIFVWAVRDFTLQLNINGVEVSSDSYLESALALKKGASKQVTEFNMPRKCIRRYFPTRKCFTFPFPLADTTQMAQLESLTADKFKKEFLICSKEFCDYVFSTSKPKQVNGIVMNGRKFAGLVEMYTSKICHGAIPSVENAVTSIARKVNEAARSECIKYYMTFMSSVPLPTKDEQTLETQHEQCVAEVDKMFKSQIMVIDVDKEHLAKQLADDLSEKYKEMCTRNEEESIVKSRKTMEKLIAPLRTKIEKDMYYQVGGYTQYQKDFAEICSTYYLTPANGVKASVVLQEYVEKMSPHAKGIMQIDKLTTAQKNSEVQRLIDEAYKRNQAEIKRTEEQNARLYRDHVKRQQDFEAAVNAKFEEQGQIHLRHLDDLMTKLSGEKDRLKNEGAHEDVSEISEAIESLRTTNRR